MNTKQLSESIKATRAAALPLFVVGPPGGGKSATVKAVADELGIGLIDIRASQTEPVDWRGLPIVNENETRWVTPSFFPRGGKGIFFLDEMNAAPPSVQVVLYQILGDRRCGDYTLPEGWSVVAAGNRAEDRAVVVRMSSAINNRVVIVDLETDTDCWLDWWWENPLSEIVEQLGFFISFRRDLLHSFDPQSKEPSFPSPRSWEMVAKIQATKPSPEIEQSLIAGTVGKGAAAEYLAFSRIYKSLPSLDSILLDPMGARVPDEPSAQAATIAGLSKKAAPSNIGAILQYAGRLSREFEFMAFHLSRRFCPEVQDTREAAKWMSANNKFLMAH